MLLKLQTINKPPPYARVDLTHPLGRKCQAVCLFNDDPGPAKNAGSIANTFVDAPSVQYYQTQGGRSPLVFGTSVPTYTYNSHGKAISFGSTFSGMDIGLIIGRESHDMDYPEFLIGSTVTRGETILIIRRKTDTTARSCTLFGVEDALEAATGRCGAHVPFSDGTVYFDYGGAAGSNRLTLGGLTFTTNVEKWVFHAGPRGSAFWRDGIKLTSQSTALTRVFPVSFVNDGGWILNGGNGLSTSGGGDLQEVNFVMYIAEQWDDDRIRWWFGEPYAAFYTDFMDRSYFFIGAAAAAGGARSYGVVM
jgi:hypothetical protein